MTPRRVKATRPTWEGRQRIDVAFTGLLVALVPVHSTGRSRDEYATEMHSVIETEVRAIVIDDSDGRFREVGLDTLTDLG